MVPSDAGIFNKRLRGKIVPVYLFVKQISEWKTILCTLRAFMI